MELDDSRHLHLRGALGTVRTEHLDGQEYLIVPVVALMDGVIHAVNASEPERVTTATLAKAAASWNGRPLVLGHPTKNGRQCSANEPGIKSSHHFGMIFNSRMVGSKLLMDAYVDPVRAEKIGGADFVKKLRNGEQIEVSVGAYVQTRPEEGVYNGRAYKAAWLETHGDHLAFLPGGKGACSIEMGCGAHRAAQMHLVTAEEFKILGSSSSGNFGHSGRPGQVGGSGKGGSGGGGGNRYKDVDGSKAAATAAAVAASEKAIKSGKAEDHEAAAELHGKAVSKYPSAGYSAVGKFDSTKDDVMFGTHDELQQLHKEAAGDPDYQDLIVESGDDLPSALENIKEYDSPEAAKRWADADQEHHDEMIKQGFVQDKSGEYVEANPKPRGKNDPIAKWEANHPGEKWKPGQMGGHPDAKKPRDPGGKTTAKSVDRNGPFDPKTGKNEWGGTANPKSTAVYLPSKAMVAKGEKPSFGVLDDAAIAKYNKEHGKPADYMWDNPDNDNRPDPKDRLKPRGASSRDCSVCDGTGQVKNEKQQQEDCPSCEGAGKITAAETNDGTAVEEAQMKKVDAIKALTACPCSGFVAADAKELESFSEERLTAMAEAATARKAAQDKSAADLKAAQDSIVEIKAAAEKVPTEDEYLAKAPESIRTLVAEKKAQDAKAKADLVAQLKTAAAGAYTEAELNEKPIAELLKLAQMAKVQPADYSGRSIPMRAASEASTYTPPDPYAAQLKVLQGKTAVN